MKTLKRFSIKLLALLLCIISSLSLFACTNKGDNTGGGEKPAGDGNDLGNLDLKGDSASNDANTLEIQIYNAGYGVKWLVDCATEFMAQNPDIKIVADNLDESISVSNLLAAGPKNTTADLFIVGGDVNGIVAKGSQVLSGYDCVLEPIDDVYTATVEGSTLLQKMDESVSSAYLREVTLGGNLEEHYFAVPWTSGFGGIFYSQTLFTQAGLTGEPRTTDELQEYCVALKSNGTYPFIYSATDDYFQYCSWTWWAQYEGQEGLDNFYNGKTSATARPSASQSRNIFNQEGLREMFKVYEELLDPSKDWVYPYVESLAYTEAQAYYLLEQGAYGAMMPNGTWLENEMINSSANQSIGSILPMKTPVISALSDKMSYWAEDKNFTEASKTMSKATRQAYDAKLRALVDYADGVASRPAWATDEDVALIVKSRAYEQAGVGSAMCIPIYATAKDAAKKFLKFLTTNKAMELYLAGTNGSAFPWSFDIKNWSGYNSLSAFAKRKFEIMENIVTIKTESAFPTYYIGGLRYDTGLKNSNFVITFGARNSERYNADQVITNAFNYYTEQRMGQLLQNSGLL